VPICSLLLVPVQGCRCQSVHCYCYLCGVAGANLFTVISTCAGMQVPICSLLLLPVRSCRCQSVYCYCYLRGVAGADILAVSAAPLTVELTDSAAQTRLVFLLVTVAFYIACTQLVHTLSSLIFLRELTIGLEPGKVTEYRTNNPTQQGSIAPGQQDDMTPLTAVPCKNCCECTSVRGWVHSLHISGCWQSGSG